MGRSALAPAWMDRLNGRTILAVSLPLAEKILHPEATERSRSIGAYPERWQEADLTILKHERVHCSGEGLIVGSDSHFGITAEELRAEHFSGDRQGYQDAKMFGRDLELITGRSLVSYFKHKVKGGDAYVVHAAIAHRLGLGRMAEVVMAQPHNYRASETNRIARAVNDYLGSYDDILARVYKDEIARGGQAGVELRVDEALDDALVSKWGLDGFLFHRRRSDVNFMANKLVARLAERRA